MPASERSRAENGCDDGPRLCESPHLMGACASVGIEEGKTTRQMMLMMVCADCLVREGPSGG